MNTPEILAAIVLPLGLAVIGYFVRAINQAGEKTARIGETMSEAIKQMAVKIAALEEAYRHQTGDVGRLRVEFHAHDELERRQQNETARLFEQANRQLERGVSVVEKVIEHALRGAGHDRPPPRR